MNQLSSQNSAQTMWDLLKAVKTQRPLVHNITNYVVMEFTANALLAIGASPVMAHATQEVQEMVTIANALVLNIGTLSEPWVNAMSKALQKARMLHIPTVFDPVGAGATTYRNMVTQQILAEKPSIIRGNASEIRALVDHSKSTKGVDSSERSQDIADEIQSIASALGCIIVVSGEIDFISDGTSIIEIHNGHPWMQRVTGMGCAATALIGAMTAIADSKLDGCAAAMAISGIAGEIAAEQSLHQGLGSFKVHYLDALSTITQETLEKKLNIIYR